MIVMLCTVARGGMRSVVEGYRDDGIFDKWGVSLIDTHVEGGYGVRFKVFCSALFRFVGLLARRQIYGLHCHVAAYGSFWRKSIFASLAHLSKVPVILHLHGSRTKEFVARQPHWCVGLIRWQLRKANAVVVLSESWKEYILSIEPDARVRVIPNGVTLPKEHDVAATGDECVNILFLGEIGERKGVYDLLRALQGVIRQCKKYACRSAAKVKWSERGIWFGNSVSRTPWSSAGGSSATRSWLCFAGRGHLRSAVLQRRVAHEHPGSHVVETADRIHDGGRNSGTGA